MITFKAREFRLVFMLSCFILICLSSELSADWRTETIDDRHVEISVSAGPIDLDTSGYPHIFYVKNGVWQHAYFNGAEWQYENMPYNFGPAVIDSNNKLHVMYTSITCTSGRCDEWEDHLIYATNASGTWVTTVVDTDYGISSRGGYPLISNVSIALDSNNKAHVVYKGFYYVPTRYATNESGSWIKTNIAPGWSTLHSSVAADSNGKAHISYYNDDTKELLYATNISGTWISSTIDSLGDVGSYNKVAIDSNNNAHISYYDASNRNLKYASNKSGSWVHTTIDNGAGNNVGQGSRIAVDSNDHVHISYNDGTSTTVKHITNASGLWVPSVVASGRVASMIIDANDTVHISYNTCLPSPSCLNEVRYAHNSSGSWSEAVIDGSQYYFVTAPSIALDSNSNVTAVYTTSDGLTLARNTLAGWIYEVIPQETAYSPRVVIDRNDKLHICYKKRSSQINYLTNKNGFWQSEFTGAEDCDGIVIDSNGKAHILSHISQNSNLNYVTNASGPWVTTRVTDRVGLYNSIAVDSNNKVHISTYYDSYQNLGYWTNTSGAWSHTLIDHVGKVGTYNSIGVDSNNKVHINYLDETLGELKYATNASGAWLTYNVAENAAGPISLAIGPGDSIHTLYRGNTQYTYVTNESGSWVFSDIGANGYMLIVDTLGFAHIGGSPSTYTTNAPLSQLAGASIAAGHDHTLYIKPDGTLWAWGLNDSGQLGDSTIINRLNPVQIGSDADWKAVSAGWKHSIAIKKDGTLWTWGNNNYGQLGDGSTTERHVPVQIGSGTDWNAISSGGAHNLALKTNGTLWAWGLNTVGQIGDGTTTTMLSPVQIGSDTNWTLISAGWEHSAAIKSDKSLYTWGWNNEGQLGNGTRTDSYTPVKIGSNEWMDVSAGWQHTIAIKDDGSLWAWGDNNYAQLGDGTTTDSVWPKQIGSYTDWSAVAAGGAHTIGLRTNGTLWAWGANWQGQIGDGTITMRTSPVQIGSNTDWGVISAGWEHSAGLKSDASLLAWGWNEHGQLGNGTTGNQYFPLGIDRVKIAGTSLYYFLIQNAYDDAISGDAVLSRGISVNGDLYADRDISVSLEGGYDSGFSMITGMTTINGNVIISNGTLSIGNFIVQ